MHVCPVFQSKVKNAQILEDLAQKCVCTSTTFKSFVREVRVEAERGGEERGRRNTFS